MICGRCNRLIRDGHNCNGILSLLLLFERVTITNDQGITIRADRDDAWELFVISSAQLEMFRGHPDALIEDALLDLDRRMR